MQDRSKKYENFGNPAELKWISVGQIQHHAG
jgi:hypothetical protein